MTHPASATPGYHSRRSRHRACVRGGHPTGCCECFEHVHARHRPATDEGTLHGPESCIRGRAPGKQQGQQGPFQNGARDPAHPKCESYHYTKRPIGDGQLHQVGSFSVACHEACGLAQRHCRLPRLWRPRVALAGCVTWRDPGGTLGKTQGSLHALLSDAMVPVQL